MSQHESNSSQSDGVECPTCESGFDTAVAVKAHHQHHERTYYEATIRRDYGVPAEWLIETQYRTLDRPVTEISELLDISVCAIEKMRDRYDIETKDRRNGEWVECAWCGSEKWVPQSRLDRAENSFCDMDCRREWEANQHIEVECVWCGSSKEVHKTRVETTEKFFCGNDSECLAKWRAENLTGENHPRWTRRDVACAHCGETKEVPKCIAEQPRHFCNGDCRSGWISENLSGKNASQWVERIEIQCDWCGTVKKELPSIATQHDHYFCGQSCKYAWQSENFAGENHPNWTKDHVECAWCSDEFMLPASRREGAERHFCPGKDCYGEWQSVNRCGENNPRWEGGQFPYGPGWNEAKKEAVRERDGYECRGCGLCQDSHIEEQGRKLDVHHITPARQFDDPDIRNAMENLITLCVPCHKEWEQMAPLRPDTAEAGD